MNLILVFLFHLLLVSTTLAANIDKGSTHNEPQQRNNSENGVHVMNSVNQYGQLIGKPLPEWTIRPEPKAVTLVGRTCRLEPLDIDKHADEIYAAYNQPLDYKDWTFLPIDAFDNVNQFYEWIETTKKSNILMFAVIDLVSGKAIGLSAFVKPDPVNGVIEVGAIFSPLLKRTVASTESQYLLMAHAFDELGYRRYEWRCDSLNTQSRRAAERLGFKFEGIFRQHAICKGRNQDIAWYSIIDEEWPQLKAGFQAWLAPGNFDEHGNQLKTLKEFQKNYIV